MILTENEKILKKYLPNLLAELKNFEANADPSSIAKIESTRTEFPTLKCVSDSGDTYLHSKYDPIHEADRVISQHTDFSKYEHVFFYGVGLGYHIEIILNLYLHLSFSIYEPRLDVLYQFVCNRSLETFPIEQLKKLYIEKKNDDYIHNIQDFISGVNEKVLFIPWPSYKQLDEEQYHNFANTFREKAAQSISSMYTDYQFEKRWTLNSLVNLSTTLQTPNILLGKERYFQNKPAIIVAAGPSLQDEIENLRHIKQQGLAYIFSVGSAIKALVSHDIYPDAACTYDPMPWNDTVFADVIDQNITSIPLIYGTSVGFETIQKYPGPKAHMLTNQDTVSPFYIQSDRYVDIDSVHDAPSVAIIALQLLHKLKCSPILLVGQNLAFRNNQFYSKGIQYKDRAEQALDSELKEAFPIPDVHGGEVQTNPSFNNMKREMETVIRLFGITNLINTTQGGARIEGTEFMPLFEVMKTKLNANVVDTEWSTPENPYRISHIRERAQLMSEQLKEARQNLEHMLRLFKKMEQFVRWKDVKSIEKTIDKFDKTILRLEKNEFYNRFLKLMNRLQYDLLFKTLDDTRKERDPYKKAEGLLQHHRLYLYDCYRDLKSLEPQFNDTHRLISQQMRMRETYEHVSE